MSGGRVSGTVDARTAAEEQAGLMMARAGGREAERDIYPYRPSACREAGAFNNN